MHKVGEVNQEGEIPGCRHCCRRLTRASAVAVGAGFKLAHEFKPAHEEEEMSDPICYCFGYTEDDLRRDVLAHGRSLIMEGIVAEKRRGRCRCVEKNPSGR